MSLFFFPSGTMRQNRFGQRETFRTRYESTSWPVALCRIWHAKIRIFVADRRPIVRRSTRRCRVKIDFFQIPLERMEACMCSWRQNKPEVNRTTWWHLATKRVLHAVFFFGDWSRPELDACNLLAAGFLYAAITASAITA